MRREEIAHNACSMTAVRFRAALAGVLVLSFGLRIFGIGWGMVAYPEATRTTEYVSSYHLDEDNVLWALTGIDASHGNFDVVDYHWGTLQFYLVYAALIAGEAVGAIGSP